MNADDRDWTNYEHQLREIIESVERIRRDYPDVPVRFEFAADVWARLRLALDGREEKVSVSDVLTRVVYPPGIPCVVDPTSGPGEWGPVFRTRS